jgi:predicted nucleic acid-binding Zn ribbon protein
VSDDEPEDEERAAEPSPGEDLARRLLARARAAAGPGRTTAAGPRRGGARRQPRRAEDDTWSSARPDARDPGRIGDALRDLVGDREWGDTLAAAGVVGRWDQIVGADVAAHCRPTRLQGGELTLVAESTAWATQIRLLSRQLVERISSEVGPGVVRAVRVHGPTAPDWRHGPRRVVGRGPRDTYG